jgi:hypothetical protein
VGVAVSFTQPQIDNAFEALGLALPDAAELTALENVSDYYQGVQDIVTLPEVQTEVAPIAQMFEAAFGRGPTSQTLASMVSSQLTEPELAAAFVSSQAFANVYNNGTLLNPNSLSDPEIIESLFIRVLDHPPTAATLAGFSGLTITQSFQAFVTSQAVTASLGSNVDTYLTQTVELAVGVIMQSETVQIVGQTSLLTHGAHIA